MASIFMFISMYGLVPFAAYLGGILLDKGVFGMFLGFTFTFTYEAIQYLSVLLCIDINYAQEVTIKRIIKDKIGCNFLIK